MPTVYSESMPDRATYWPSAGVNDGFGGVSKAFPVVISCRWQDKAVKFRSPSGDELVSESVVYCAHEIQVGGLLHHGDLTDEFDSDGWLAPPVTAKEIMQRQVSPSLDNSEALHKALL